MVLLPTKVIDVERIRCAAERHAYPAVEREIYGGWGAFSKKDTSARRRTLLANALQLSETMAPDAYRAALEAMTALGVEDRIELFQSSGHGTDTARLVLYGKPIGVELIGGYLDALDHEGLVAVLGHEIGHSLAHGDHQFGWALAACAYANTPARRAYSMAAEFTADRFGLLACRDLDAVLRLEMQSSAGRLTRNIHFDTREYLDQCRAIAEETIAKGAIAMGSTHPEHYVRGYAVWLFSETDVHRAITGTGIGSRSLDEVDAILQELIGPSQRGPSAGAIAKPLHGAGSAGTTSSVGRRPDAAAPERGSTLDPSQRPPAEVFEGARRTLAAARTALEGFARAAVPSIRSSIEGLGAPRSRADAPGEADPLEEERRELMAKFDELKRRSNAD